MRPWLALILLIGPCRGISQGQVSWGDERPIVGTVLGDQHTLRFSSLGVEAWSGGKRAAGLEQWDMECRFSDRQGTTPGPDCFVARVPVDERTTSQGSATAPGRRLVARTSDGSLRFGRIDWASGVVEFQLGTAPGAMRCLMTVRVKDGTISLERFRGTPAVPDQSPARVSPLEWRVAEYDRPLAGSRVLKGMHSDDDRRWNEMIRTLGTADRQQWEAMRQSPDRERAFGRADVDIYLNELLEQELATDPDTAFVARLRDDLPEEAGDHERLKAVNERAARRLHESWARSFDGWLHRHGMSPAGRERILALLRAAWNLQPAR